MRENTNRDSALPDQDTLKIPATSDIADAETAHTAAVGAPNPSTVNTLVTRAVDDAAKMPTIRTPAVMSPPSARRGRIPLFVWLRAPEFWLAIALAAFLRLWHIDLTQFLDDQAQLMAMARDAWLHGALPITGIPSSIGTLNPPLSIYLLAPFTLLSKDPLPAAIAIALWNVLGVALCYIFARRYFGRVIATSAALLFASSGSAVYYSRFIWQQNWLPPLIALWLLTLYLGCVSGRRGWFAPHVALLTAAMLLHPSAALLLPVSLVGFALTPRRALPSRWEWVIATGLVALLLAPSLLWEALSSGSDIRLYAHYLKQGSAFNLDVFGFLASLLGAPPSSDLGTDTIYAQAGGWTHLVHIAMLLCFAAGIAVLTERLARVSFHVWHDGSAATGGTSRLRPGALAIWRGLRAEPTWRAHLLLWLSVFVPVILLLRHNSDLHVHYLFILYPTVFIIAGFAVQAVWRLPGKRLPSLALIQPVVRRLAPAAILVLLAALIMGQAVQSALYPATLASGSFSAFGNFGYPLAEIQRLDGELGALQHEQHARAIFISLSQSYRLQPALDYLTVSEQADRVGFNSDCLVLPAPDETPALIVATQPPGLANTLLADLPGLTSATHLPMAGDDDILVYQMQEALPLLSGEQATDPVTFTDAAGNGLRLVAISFQSGLIRLRWTAIGPATTGDNPPQYRILPTERAADGATHALGRTDCHPTRWHTGETVFTWVSPGDAATAQTLLLQVFAGPSTPAQPTIGPVRLLTGDAAPEPQTLLRPSSGAATSDGALAIPLTRTP